MIPLALLLHNRACNKVLLLGCHIHESVRTWWILRHIEVDGVCVLVWVEKARRSDWQKTIINADDFIKKYPWVWISRSPLIIIYITSTTTTIAIVELFLRLLFIVFICNQRWKVCFTSCILIGCWLGIKLNFLCVYISAYNPARFSLLAFFFWTQKLIQIKHKFVHNIRGDFSLWSFPFKLFFSPFFIAIIIISYHKRFPLSLYQQLFTTRYLFFCFFFFPIISMPLRQSENNANNDGIQFWYLPPFLCFSFSSFLSVSLSLNNFFFVLR